MSKKPDPFMVDDENPLLTTDFFENARPGMEVDPEFVKAMVAMREAKKSGRPPATDPLVNLTIRVPKSSLPKLRAIPSYQTRITELVRGLVGA